MSRKVNRRYLALGICAGLAAITWVVFAQTARFPFINYDDPEYVYEVPEINAGLKWHGIKWAFTHWPSTNWFPLPNISHMFEFQFFGFNPGAFHLTNVVLHTLSALLLFLVLRQLTEGRTGGNNTWKSAFVAAIFAIHPLRVESVAWIIERKDVMSGFFFMLTLGAYFYYTRKPSVARYVLMSILFACGLLSKPMLVTTPVILLLLDYWPLNRSQRSDVSVQKLESGIGWQKLILEKIPLFVMSGIVAVLTSRGITPAHSVADRLPLLWRVSNAVLSYVTYIRQMLWPAKLAVFYPYPQDHLPVWQFVGAAALLGLITAACFAQRRPRPYLLVGWLWYLVMLAPAIGIVQINLQAHADRYTYLPQIGLYLMITWGVADFSKTPNAERRTSNVEWKIPNRALGVFCVAIITVLALTTRAQASYWRDSETLWSHTITVTKDNYFAHASLADLLMRRGRMTEAIAHSQEVLRIRPRDADGQNNLGLALLQMGDLSGAIVHLTKALETDAGHMNAEVNLAWVLATAPDASMRDGPRAVALAEDVGRRSGHANAIVLRTLAAAYAETGRFRDAIHTAQQAFLIAKATGNDGLATDLERNIASYRESQPLRTPAR